MSELKEIIEQLPKVRGGRELTIQYERISHRWYAGYPNLDGDFSIDLYEVDFDVEGAALHLLSSLDTEKLTKKGV